MTHPDGLIDDQMRTQLGRLASLDFYRARAQAAGLDLARITTWDEFRRLPLLGRAEFETCFESDSAWGGFWVPGIVRMNFTPSAQVGLLPEFNTRADLAASATALADVARAAGVSEGDVVQITLGYHILVAGRLFDEGFAELGAVSLQAGAVSTEQQLNLARRGRPTVLMTNPSFGQKLGDEGLRGIRRMILTGEPFTAIPGRREALKATYGPELVSAVDTYGVSECFPVAAECASERGMHLMESFCVTEVIDPDTLQPVPPGHPGELVVTHRDKEAMPFLRYRTGDLAVVEPVECDCGARWTLPRGVFGRTDSMSKVKGVKLYPTQVALILAGVAGLDPRRFRITIRADRGIDQIDLRVVGDAGVVERAVVHRLLKDATLLSFNNIDIVDDLDDGDPVCDLRGVDDRTADTSRGRR